METCGRLSLLLLELIYITLSTVFEAQEIRIWPEVTGYVGDDVTLTCHFIKGPADSGVSQTQWDLLLPEGKKIPIIVSNIKSVNIFNSTLKERVSFAGFPKYDQSLVIRDVQTADGGLYQCSVATFPSGSFDRTTQLIVRDQKPLSPGVVAGIVIAVLLLLVIVAATAYLIVLRKRHKGLVNHAVFIDTGGLTVDDTMTPATEQSLVYSDINFKPSRSRNNTPAAKDNHTEATYADDVIYSKVVVGHKRPK